MTDREQSMRQAVQEELAKRDDDDKDPHRLTFHLDAPSGLINDPNGLVFFKGNYHLFFQWNPFETSHGAKFWGHATSTNLLTWKLQSPALAPIEWYEKNGCYSGSAVVWNERLYLFYTGNVKSSEGRETYQCLAISDDGVSFHKQGPVVYLPKGYTAHFRDPKVIRQDDAWIMLIGAQAESGRGAVVSYKSDNLYDWSLDRVIDETKIDGAVEMGYMWECPDFIDYGEYNILMMSPQGMEPIGLSFHNLFQSGYVVSSNNQVDLEQSFGPFRELDHGFDFYAPQSYVLPDGRHILIAWMGMSDETEAFHPTIDNGWVHALTMPRELRWDGHNLLQSPVRELREMRSSRKWEGSLLKGMTIPNSQSGTLELVVEPVDEGDDCFTFSFHDEVFLNYNKQTKRFTLKRRHLKTGMDEVRQCQLHELMKLHVIIDQSSVEVFINDGSTTFTTRFFPDEQTGIFLQDGGSCHVQMWVLHN